MGMSMKFLTHFNHRERTLGSSDEPLKIAIDLDYFPHQPKNNKNRKSHDKEKGTQCFNVFEFYRRSYHIKVCYCCASFCVLLTLQYACTFMFVLCTLLHITCLTQLFTCLLMRFAFSFNIVALFVG